MTPHPNLSTRHALAWLLALASACAQASPSPDGPAPAPAAASAKTTGTTASPSKPPAAGQAAGGAPQAADAATAPPQQTVDRKIQGLDTLEQLREKLSQRIGATKAVDRKSVVVMQVATPAGNDMQVSPRAAAASARSTRLPGAPKAGGAAAKAAAVTGAHATEAHAASPTHWDYSGVGGPQAWGTMKPEFSTCATGQRQSPIDIRDGIAVDLEPVLFEYRQDSAFSVIDNGHTVQVNLAPGNAIQVLGRRYELLQFHFHRPSEERVGGRQFDMVAHLVHRDAEDRLAVVAVLLERGSVQPIVQTVWNNLPLEKHEAQPARVTLDLNALLPTDRRYYTYMGSLTTPPCSEGVLWMVMKQPVAVSAEQIDIFARLYPMNARPVQNAAGRLIKQSN